MVRRRAKQGSFLAFCPGPIILKIEVRVEVDVDADVVVFWSDQSTSYFFNGGHAQAIWKFLSQTGSLDTRPSCHFISKSLPCHCYQPYFLELFTAFGQCHFKTKLLHWIKPENACLSLLSNSHSSWICDSAFWKQRLVIEKERSRYKKISLSNFFRNLHVCSIHSFTKCIIRYRTHVSEKKCGGECNVWLILLSTEKTLCVRTQKQFSLCFPSLLKWDCT